MKQAIFNTESVIQIASVIESTTQAKTFANIALLFWLVFNTRRAKMRFCQTGNLSLIGKDRQEKNQVVTPDPSV
ncbi:MAG TPA: hypothetical protein VNQ76_18330 [Planctomicrobium sp.]|nr:hypothetical protein [Planctomicrobium sp.]